MKGGFKPLSRWGRERLHQ